ncbi:MAG TPA: hypothetical protein PK156_08495, partial [Polyangium sp.]|nr:hypothetical protein [Polyangium sp.]
DQLVVDPMDASHLVLRTTYGILSSSDAGASWGWVCEAAVGYGGTQDPAMGVMADGSVLAGIFEGLSVTHDRGCSWAFATAPLEGEYVIDVSVHRDEPSRAVAITSTGAGSGFHVILAETSDNAATWTQAGIAINSDMISLTVDVAPSQTNSVYVSGIVGKVYAPALERTDDRGQTWTRTFFDAAYADEVPYIAAVDPTNPDRVYVRLSGTDTDHLLFSEDGAQTFTEIFSTASDLLGFALSPDGQRVAIGSTVEGILIASTTDHAFQKVSSVESRCLTWTNAGIYSCANEFTDGFTLGLSKDEGKTFTKLYKLAEICPLECPDGAKSTTACTASWPPLAATLGVDQSKCGMVVGSSSSSSGGTTSPPSDPQDGCACDLTKSSGQTAAGVMALGSLLAALSRKRSRKP